MQSRNIRIVVALAMLLPFAACFGTVLTGSRILAYRDAAHFYYPLYAWTTACWGRGDVPLWNAQQGTGVPAIAEATSAVFYPGQLVFVLPLDYTLRYNLYVSLHVLLAAWVTYALARAWKTSRAAAGLAGVAYAIGGVVLFQHCNVVYLVGAAWLPLALLATDRMLIRRSLCWSMLLGISMAFMVLGGDPQSAYHAGLMAALYALLRRVARKRSESRSGELSSDGGWRSHPIRLLAAAASTAVLLSAVQILPSILWTSASVRAAFQYPRSVYEIPSYLARPKLAAGAGAEDSSAWRGVAKGLTGRPPAGTHHRYMYDFSIGPWRLLETAWPNCGGRMFPENRRWMAEIPAEGRVWTASLYLGLLPLLLGLRAWRLRTSDCRVRWLSWILLLGVLGSFGWYGPGWLWHEIQTAVTGHAPRDGVGEPTGGLYWLLVVLLPGYAYFRYPAKLLTCSALALSLLAAFGCDHALQFERERLRRSLARVGLASVAIGGAVLLSRPWWPVMLADARPDELFGPLDVHGAWTDTLLSLIHAAVVCGVCFGLLRADRLRMRTLACLLLVVTAAELTIANRWMVLTAPLSALQTAGVLPNEREAKIRRRQGHRLVIESEQASRRAENADPPVFYRYPSRRWVPRHWTEASSADRAAETIRWDRATLFPNFYLLGNGVSLRPLRTITPRAYRAFLHGMGPRPHPAVLSALGADYLILPDTFRIGSTDIFKPCDGKKQPRNVRVWRSLDARPQAWIVHHVECWPLMQTNDPVVLDRVTRQLLFPEGQARDLRRTAVVETDTPFSLAAVDAPIGEPFREPCRVHRLNGNRLEVETTLQRAGLLVLRDLYWRGWIAELVSEEHEPKRIPILRVNRIMRGVLLPAGHHRLVFRFAPRDVYIGGAISLGTWLIVLTGFTLLALRRRRSRTG